jgi:phospholipid/cholesterol/gamma-HCH transport system substrate-binding protein
MLKKVSNEIKVGLLILTSLAFVLLCAWFIGVKNPFHQTVDFYVTYNFAGGIESGSPVRVAGIKVGKVESISFYRPDASSVTVDNQSEVLTPLKIKISISKEASESVRTDSKFYINLAGLIGERYIEITPGTYGAKLIADSEVVRGIDPPRIDQLISQSFNLAGKIQEVIENNEGDITKSIKLVYELSSNINKAIGQIDKSKIFKTNVPELINNLIEITGDVKRLTAKTQTEEGKKTLELLYKLLWRLEGLDKEAIHKFLQKEGIRARIL